MRFLYYLSTGRRDAQRAGWALLVNTLIVAGICLPVLLLLGLNRGLVTQFRDNIQKSPTAREIQADAGSAGSEACFTASQEQHLVAENPQIAIVIPQIKANGWLVNRSGKELEAQLTCTKPGDPFLAFYGADVLQAQDHGAVITQAVADDLLIAYREVTDKFRKKRCELAGPSELTLQVQRSGDDQRYATPVPVRYIIASDDRSWKGVYLSRQMMDWLETFKRGGAVKSLGWPSSFQTLKAEYDGYLAFVKEPLPPGDVTRLKEIGLTAVRLEDLRHPMVNQMRCLYGLLRPHDLAVYWLSATHGKPTVSMAPKTVEDITNADDRVMPWTEPQLLRINGLLHWVIGATGSARWLRAYYRNPETRFNESDDELMEVMLPPPRHVAWARLGVAGAPAAPVVAVGAPPAAPPPPSAPPPSAPADAPAAKDAVVPKNAPPADKDAPPAADLPPADASAPAGNGPAPAPAADAPSGSVPAAGATQPGIKPGDVPAEDRSPSPTPKAAPDQTPSPAPPSADAAKTQPSPDEKMTPGRTEKKSPSAEGPPTAGNGSPPTDRPEGAAKQEAAPASQPQEALPLAFSFVDIATSLTRWLDRFSIAWSEVPAAVREAFPEPPAGRAEALQDTSLPETVSLELPDGQNAELTVRPLTAGEGDVQAPVLVAWAEFLLESLADHPAVPWLWPAEGDRGGPASGLGRGARDTVGWRFLQLVDQDLFGVQSTPLAVVPAKLVAHVARSREGAVAFDPLINRFVLAPGENKYTSARIYTADIDFVPDVDDWLREHHYATNSSRMKVEEMKGYVRTLSLILNVILASVLGFGAVTTFSVFWDFTRARRGAIGVMRLMGTPAVAILLFVYVRGAVVGLLGALTTVAAGYAIAWGLASFASADCAIAWADVGWILGGACLCCLVGVTVPALYAAFWLDPADTISGARVQ